MNLETLKLKKSDLRFVDKDALAFVSKDENDKPRLEMLIYSGKEITGHWYWGKLAIDLEGGKYLKKRYPVLEDHLTSRKVAHMGKPIVEDGKLKAPEEVVFLDTEASREFQDNSAKDFPYEASLYARPTSIERIEEGTSADVNGFKMKGPGYIWRQWEFKEASIVVFGADSNTSSKAFADDEDDIEITVNNLTKETERKEVEERMDKQKLSDEHPELLKEVQDEAREEGRAESEAKFAEEKEDLEKKITDLEAKLSEKETTETELQQTVDKLKEKDSKRDLREIQLTADSIWDKALGDSSIPEAFHEDIKPLVSHDKYVKRDDGEVTFDKEKFTEAVDAKVKSWEEKGMKNGEVLGLGSNQRTVDGDSEEKQKLAKEDDEWANSMLKELQPEAVAA